jgi:hypothetical protein
MLLIVAPEELARPFVTGPARPQMRNDREVRVLHNPEKLLGLFDALNPFKADPHIALA